MHNSRSLVESVLQSCETFAHYPAVSIAGEEISYRDLEQQGKSLAATLRKVASTDHIALTAVLGYRSRTAYAGVVGALLAGHGYVPLNPTFPLARTKLMLERSKCRSLIVDARSEPQLENILNEAPSSLIVICPDRDDTTDLAKRLPKHCIIGATELLHESQWTPPTVDQRSIAYILFTSGSTGEPKGVVVSHGNVLHYVDYVTKRYGITSLDRLSQTFDLTFDLSAHDLFVTWGNGACLCVPTQKQMIKPGAFINGARLTAWFSVPSTAIFMRRLGELKPGLYPNLRLSLFCGEALPVEVVVDWSAAAPNSRVENVYGPTELTIGCTAYQWDSRKSPDECERGIVPIGDPFEDMEAVVVDEELREVPDGCEGELLMTGPQLSQGYWCDKERTRCAFVSLPGRKGVYYRTGDRVRATSGKPLIYLGRVDHQVKVLGHRVELGEVEAVVRKFSGVDGIVALGFPNGSSADRIELFLETDELDTTMLLSRLKATLPSYMVPREIRTLSRFPLNPNGKYDRRALEKMLAHS